MEKCWSYGWVKQKTKCILTANTSVTACRGKKKRRMMVCWSEPLLNQTLNISHRAKKILLCPISTRKRLFLTFPMPNSSNLRGKDTTFTCSNQSTLRQWWMNFWELEFSRSLFGFLRTWIDESDNRTKVRQVPRVTWEWTVDFLCNIYLFPDT